MADFLKKALLSLVMDKQARETLEQVKKAKELEDERRALAPSARPSSGVGAESSPAPGSERERLIKEALAVRREKAKLLDELSPEDRFKLKVMAAKAFMGDSKDGQDN